MPSPDWKVSAPPTILLQPNKPYGVQLRNVFRPNWRLGLHIINLSGATPPHVCAYCLDVTKCDRWFTAIAFPIRLTKCGLPSTLISSYTYALRHDLVVSKSCTSLSGHMNHPKMYWNRYDYVCGDYGLRNYVISESVRCKRKLILSWIALIARTEKRAFNEFRHMHRTIVG